MIYHDMTWYNYTSTTTYTIYFMIYHDMTWYNYTSTATGPCMIWLDSTTYIKPCLCFDCILAIIIFLSFSYIEYSYQ